MTALTKLTKRLLEVAEKATQDLSCWRPLRTGLVPDKMRSLAIVCSHNRTPYMSVENAEFVSLANPHTIQTLVKIIDVLTIALERYADSSARASGALTEANQLAELIEK